VGRSEIPDHDGAGGRSLDTEKGMQSPRWGLRDWPDVGPSAVSATVATPTVG
jgi:hypothetical protein